METSMPNGSANLLMMLRTFDRLLSRNLQHASAEAALSVEDGIASDMAARHFLSAHLPNHLAVGTGEIVDQEDSRSGDLGIVVSSEDQPFRCDIDAHGMFLMEGVVAAGEAVSFLTEDSLAEVIQVGARYKRLRCRYLVGDEALSNPADVARFYECPPFFVLAFETSIKIPKLMDQLVTMTPRRSAFQSGSPLAPVDAVFIVDKGCAIDLGNGRGSLAYLRTAENGHTVPVAGWVWQRTEHVLVDLLLWLSVTMPRVRRARSIAGNYLVRSMHEHHGIAASDLPPNQNEHC
jgi:hypothetical protein